MSTLVWSIKASLLEYVRSRAGGRIELSDGASADPDGRLRFPGREGAASFESRSDSVGFAGTVRITGHGGLLDLPLRALRLEPVSASGYALTIEDPDAAEERLAFVTIAAFERAGDGWRGCGTALTAEGAELFFGPYEAGTPFDDPFLMA